MHHPHAHPHDEHIAHAHYDDNEQKESPHTADAQHKANAYDMDIPASTIQELSASLGFEAENVKMALIQLQGDVSFAAEILFQMNEKTVRP